MKSLNSALTISMHFYFLFLFVFCSVVSPVCFCTVMLHWMGKLHSVQSVLLYSHVALGGKTIQLQSVLLCSNVARGGKIAHCTKSCCRGWKNYTVCKNTYAIYCKGWENCTVCKVDCEQFAQSYCACHSDL